MCTFIINKPTPFKLISIALCSFPSDPLNHPSLVAPQLTYGGFADNSSNPWMPYDEQFRAVKQGGFLKTTLSSILSAVPGFVGAAFTGKPDIANFSSFSVVHALFEDDDDHNPRMAHFGNRHIGKEGEWKAVGCLLDGVVYMF